MPILSAFLITKNESRDIVECLGCLRGIAEEVVVVDDHSADDTAALCRRAGARVFTRALEGFGPQKQFALEQTRGDWVLSIDADERVPAALAEEIRRVVRDPNAASGYEVRRDFYFLGHRLRHGGLGADWVLRLFRRGAGRFRPVRVHEGIEVRGSVGRLQTALEHYSYASLEEYMEKCNQYTTLAAQDQWSRGQRFHFWDHLRPAWELATRVLGRGAWLDGQAGLTYAALSAHAAWLRAIKLWEIENANQRAASARASEETKSQIERNNSVLVVGLCVFAQLLTRLLADSLII